MTQAMARHKTPIAALATLPDDGTDPKGYDTELGIAFRSGADCSTFLIGRHLVPLKPQLACAFYDFVAQFHRRHIVVGRNVIVIDQIA